jgi:hypothetical protein
MGGIMKSVFFLTRTVTFSLPLVAAILLAACGGNGTGERAGADTEPPENYSGILEGYFNLAEVLTLSDAEAAAEAAETFAAVLQSSNGGSSAFWADQRTILLERAQTMTGQEDVEDQRYQFESLSESMIRVAERYGSPGTAIYVQRCPMVRGGSADWLSRESGIRNPYHGDRMMTCGMTLREIR